jgi:hypothetical protein
MNKSMPALDIFGAAQKQPPITISAAALADMCRVGESQLVPGITYESVDLLEGAQTECSTVREAKHERWSPLHSARVAVSPVNLNCYPSATQAFIRHLYLVETHCVNQPVDLCIVNMRS